MASPLAKPTSDPHEGRSHCPMPQFPSRNLQAWLSKCNSWPEGISGGLLARTYSVYQRVQAPKGSTQHKRFWLNLFLRYSTCKHAFPCDGVWGDRGPQASHRKSKAPVISYLLLSDPSKVVGSACHFSFGNNPTEERWVCMFWLRVIPMTEYLRDTALQRPANAIALTVMSRIGVHVWRSRRHWVFFVCLFVYFPSVLLRYNIQYCIIFRHTAFLALHLLWNDYHNKFS